MTTALRVAGLGDVPRVLQLWRDAEVEPTHTDDAQSLEKLIQRDAGSLIVAEVGAEIVGSVIAAWDGWRGSVYRLAVAPPHRRRGLGRRLVREAEQRLTAVGAIRMQAVVVEADQPATAFWRASGWEEQLERRRFVRG